MGLTSLFIWFKLCKQGYTCIHIASLVPTVTLIRGVSPNTPFKEVFMDEKRTKSIRIRVSGKEHEMFVRKSGDVPVSEWIRDLATDGKTVKKRKIQKVDPAFLRQIAGIGNNLNQIARVVNTKKNMVEKMWLLDQLASVESNLQELRKDIENGSDLS